MPKITMGLVALFACLALITAPAFAQGEVPGTKNITIGDTLPDDFTVTGLDGSSVKLNSAGRKPYTIYQFMTTACSACYSELVALLKLQREIGKDKLEIVPISVDMAGAVAINKYEGKHKFGLRYFLDGDFNLPPRLGFPYTPSIFMVDSSGKVVYKKGGFSKVDWAATAEKIKAIVK